MPYSSEEELMRKLASWMVPMRHLTWTSANLKGEKAVESIDSQFCVLYHLEWHLKQDKVAQCFRRHLAGEYSMWDPVQDTPWELSEKRGYPYPRLTPLLHRWKSAKMFLAQKGIDKIEDMHVTACRVYTSPPWSNELWCEYRKESGVPSSTNQDQSQ